MLNILKIVNICYANPCEWEGITDDNRQILITYRDYRLEIFLGKVGNMSWCATDGVGDTYTKSNFHSIFEYITYPELKLFLKDVVSLPETQDTYISWRDLKDE